MRVLMSTDTLGGVFVYALELIRALERHGVEVSLATLGRALCSDQRRALRALRNVEAHESRWALEWMAEPWRDVERGGEWLLSLEQRYRPDCVHLNHYAHGALPWTAPVLTVGHSCVASWWAASQRGPLPDQYDRYRSVVAAALRAAHCVVAPSMAMLAALQTHYGPVARARVIANAVDATPFQPASKRPFVLSAGRLWDCAKNAAAIAIAARGLPWPVYLAGERRGPDGDHCPEDACLSLGQLSRERLAEYMAEAEVYAAPARYEPFGLSVLEAAHSGCALVLGLIPSLLENWTGAARFVDPEDPDELHRVLRELILDVHARRHLAELARRRAATFALPVMASSYVRVYAELARAPHTEGVASCAS